MTSADGDAPVYREGLVLPRGFGVTTGRRSLVPDGGLGYRSRIPLVLACYIWSTAAQANASSQPCSLHARLAGTWGNTTEH